MGRGDHKPWHAHTLPAYRPSLRRRISNCLELPEKAVMRIYQAWDRLVNIYQEKIVDRLEDRPGDRLDSKKLEHVRRNNEYESM
jgi:hypothetical protein